MGVKGYQVKVSGAECLLHSGTTPYWHIDFVNLLRGVNGSKAVNEVVFPDPVQDSSGMSVSFALTDTKGREVLRKSISLRDRAIPNRCLKTLQAAIDQMHTWADDSRVPMEKREFCRMFRLPDPRKDPEAYRMTGGMFSRKLHVLWGYEKVGSKAFLPMSRISERWDDAASRKSVFSECKRIGMRRFFRFRNLLIVSLLSAAAYVWACLPIQCSVHHCAVGNGILCFLQIDARCPKRCILSNCNRHLDASGKCSAHKCMKCGRQVPLDSVRNGVCDDCFWAIK